MPPARRRNAPIPASLSAPDASPVVVQAAPVKRRRKQAPAQEPAAVVEEAPARGFRQRSVYLEEGLWERARAAVAYVRYFEVDDEPDTLAALISAGLQDRVTEMERALNNGKPFRPAARKLPTGPGRAGVRRLEEARPDR